MFLFKQRVTSRTRLGQSSCDPPNIQTHNYISVSFLSTTAAIPDKCTQRKAARRESRSRMETPHKPHTQKLLQQLFVPHTWGESKTKVRINWGDFQPETASNGSHIQVKKHVEEHVMNVAWSLVQLCVFEKVWMYKWSMQMWCWTF